MSRMSELDSTIKELRSAAESIRAIADSLAEMFSGKPETETEVKAKPMTLPEVRAILAEKSRAGHTAEIKALLLKHGSDRLSGIEPAEYEALVAEAEELNDAT